MRVGDAQGGRSILPSIAQQLKEDGWNADEISDDEREQLLDRLRANREKNQAPALVSRKAVEVHREKVIRGVADEASQFRGM